MFKVIAKWQILFNLSVPSNIQQWCCANKLKWVIWVWILMINHSSFSCLFSSMVSFYRVYYTNGSIIFMKNMFASCLYMRVEKLPRVVANISLKLYLINTHKMFLSHFVHLTVLHRLNLKYFAGKIVYHEN